MMEFQRASEIEISREAREAQTKISIKEIVSNKWSLLGSIEVCCPSCNHIQKTQTIKAATCHRCFSRYKVFPKNGVSRVHSCPSGKLAILHDIRLLETKGRMQCIL